MTSAKTRLVFTSILLAVLVGAGVGGWWLTRDRAPNVEFTTLKGERIRLRDWRGQPVLVAFWASDCRACLEEMPDLAALHRDYGPRGLRVITVAMPYDPPNRVVALAEGRQLPYNVALDPLGRLIEAFGRVELVPNSFLIAPDGRIVLHGLGRIHAAELGAQIERLLGEN
ncbi:MAG: TlpA family protein disulfide reductase [Methylomagnum sp.]